MRGLDLRLMRSPGVWAVIWAIALLSGANLYFFTSLLLQYRFDDPITFIAIIMCVPEAAALVGCFVSGWAASRYGAPITAAVCILLAGLGALLSRGKTGPAFDPQPDLSASGFRVVRLLAERDGLRFVEGLKSRDV